MKFIGITEVFIGAAILLISIFNYYRLLRQFRDKTHEARTFSHLTYAVCFALMVFFFIGYLALGAVYVFKDGITVSDFLVSNVFFFGSIFVYVVIRVQRQMSQTINTRTDELVRTLVNAVEAKDQYTRGHSVHVANLTELFYRYLPDSIKKQVNHAHLMDAAILHDIGKIGIPDSILNKPGMLSEEEMAVIRQHPRMGKQILEYTSFKDIGDIILYHHERMDNGGYYRIPADQIPIEARIIAITDTFSALYSDRVYRPRKSYAESIGIMRAVEGDQLDKQLTEIFAAIPIEEINDATRDLFRMEGGEETASIDLKAEVHTGSPLER